MKGHEKNYDHWNTTLISNLSAGVATQQFIFCVSIGIPIVFENKNLLQSITHPVILAGVFGHFSLLYAAFTKNPKLWVELTGAILLGLLVVLFLLSGIFSKNVKMILSDLPFILMSSYYYYRLYQEKSSKSRS